MHACLSTSPQCIHSNNTFPAFMWQLNIKFMHQSLSSLNTLTFTIAQWSFSRDVLLWHVAIVQPLSAAVGMKPLSLLIMNQIRKQTNIHTQTETNKFSRSIQSPFKVRGHVCCEIREGEITQLEHLQQPQTVHCMYSIYLCAFSNTIPCCFLGLYKWPIN